MHEQKIKSMMFNRCKAIERRDSSSEGYEFELRWNIGNRCSDNQINL